MCINKKIGVDSWTIFGNWCCNCIGVNNNCIFCIVAKCHHISACVFYIVDLCAHGWFCNVFLCVMWHYIHCVVFCTADLLAYCMFCSVDLCSQLHHLLYNTVHSAAFSQITKLKLDSQQCL